jgi:uncharacterized protein (DUF302 family)
LTRVAGSTIRISSPLSLAARHPAPHFVREFHAMAKEGLITVASSFGVKETAERLVADIAAKGLTLFARVDHAAGAADVGMDLRPTEVLFFGNARGGTPLMQAEQTVGLDLPLKVLVYEDADHKVWLAYTDPHWLAQRYGLEGSIAKNVDALANALQALATKATK